MAPQVIMGDYFGDCHRTVAPCSGRYRFATIIFSTSVSLMQRGATTTSSAIAPTTANYR